MSAFTVFLILLFRFCSSSDDLWKQFFPNDNLPSNSIQNKNNPNIDTTASNYFIDFCGFKSYTKTVINIKQDNSIKFLISNSIFQKNYNSNSESNAANINILSNARYVEYRTVALNCTTQHTCHHVKLKYKDGSTFIENCTIREGVYCKLGNDITIGSCVYNNEANNLEISYINMTDVLARDVVAYYLKTPKNPVIAKYSLYCLIKTQMTKIIGFDANLNMSYCNIFN